MIKKPKKPMIDPADVEFGIICICAVRYSLGRQSYMPSLVQSYIRPYLPHICDKTLFILGRDIAEADDMWGGYGHETIDKPGWMQFLAEIRAEQERRKTADEGVSAPNEPHAIRN